MNILFSTFELAPFTKVGGLADVMGSMPKALSKLGCNIKIFAPFIGSINQEKYGIKEVADVVFYSITEIGEEEFYTPVLFLDTLKVSSIRHSPLYISIISSGVFSNSLDTII